jgi:hypothetical protein
LAAASTDIVIGETTEMLPGRSPALDGPGTSVRSADVRAEPGRGLMDFVTVRVTRVLSGTDLRVGQRVEALAFGSDEVTGHGALRDPGIYLLFLAPYVLGPGRPVGGYVVVGGPAGVFYRCASAPASAPFAKADAESPALPDEVMPEDVPAAAWTSTDYIAAGGPPIR